MTLNRRVIGMLLVATVAWPLMAEEPIQVQRHELMVGVGDAAKPLGGMLQGEVAFDAAVAMQSLETFQHSAEVFGAMFPEGSDSGHDTQALPAVWSDRAGFDAALADYSKAVDAAIAAAPQDLDALNAAAGPVFRTCKGCHETYRAEQD